ncbi:MAG: signal recognition particle-docking protein FtsY [Spirochaetia bacterium]|nr:signal recognition particle-docking protein FtsY [Spirochaetia bacterium]
MEKNSFLKPRSFLDRLKTIFSKGPAGEHIDDLEQTLIEADIDITIVEELMEALRSGSATSFEDAKKFLKKTFMDKLGAGREKSHDLRRVVLLTGINGAGKTTTASKLANLYKKMGRKVLLVAADTFRAAAIEQLADWAGQTGTDIVKGTRDGDPASAVFEGLQKAKKEGHDLVLVDTAGRLHTKVNLMQELEKVKRITLREFPEEQLDILIIIDANTGKNAFNQAKEFNNSLKLTGVILTKFDSTSKGGSIIRIKSELNLPIKYMTYGEKMDDISIFDPEEFVENLFE